MAVYFQRIVCDLWEEKDLKASEFAVMRTIEKCVAASSVVPKLGVPLAPCPQSRQSNVRGRVVA